MSTQILTLRGDIEIPIPEKRESRYEKRDMFISRFWGGNNRGQCLQFNIGNSHLQLDEETCDYLAQVLLDWRNANEEDK